MINGRAPRFRDRARDGDVPAARSSAARRTRSSRRSATSTSPSTSRRSSATSCRRGAASTSRRTPTARPTSTTTASTPPARRPTSSHDGSGTTPLFSTGNGAPGLRHDDARRPPTRACRSAPRRSSAAPAGTRSTGLSQVVDNDVDGVVEPRPRRHRAAGVDVVADGAYSAGDMTLNTVLDGTDAWETWGGTSRSTPVAAGAAALVYQAWRAGARRDVAGGLHRRRRTS